MEKKWSYNYDIIFLEIYNVTHDISEFWWFDNNNICFFLDIYIWYIEFVDKTISYIRKSSRIIHSYEYVLSI
jgi:hypothetical protein